MAFPPAPIITAPEPGVRRYGLFTVASGPLDMPAHGQGAGVRYTPPACGDSYALPVECDVDELPEPPEPDADDELVSTGVFSVRSTIECSAVGATETALRAKLTRRLEASEQGAVERSFATGLDYAGGALSILSLDSAGEAVSSAYDPTDIASVVGALLQEAVAAYGFRPTVHAPASAEPYATDAGLVVADGPLLRTPSGALWAFGNYPEGELFISGQVTIWRAQEPTVFSTFDVTTNLRSLAAERAYALGIDCGWAARADFTPLGS